MKLLPCSGRKGRGRQEEQDRQATPFEKKIRKVRVKKMQIVNTISTEEKL